MSKLNQIVDKLIAGGLPEDKTLCDREATAPCHPKEKILGPLGNLTKLAEEEGFGSPAVIFVGNAVGLAGTVDWFGASSAFRSAYSSPARSVKASG